MNDNPGDVTRRVFDALDRKLGHRAKSLNADSSDAVDDALVEAEELLATRRARFALFTGICSLFVLGQAALVQSNISIDSKLVALLALIPLAGGAWHLDRANAALKKRAENLIQHVKARSSQ